MSDDYKQYDTVEGFSKVVMMEKIEENSFNLSVSRYVENFEREELDLNVINAKVKYLEQNLSKIQKEINNYLD
ncbi:N-6 DNA methylase [Clostridium manihotivorum]|uniref:N-6 DNA methylase n=1 Tax=Clostridium manihotivorum TaxID=2320868 RepID=UPI001EE520D0|nr:N-6 DNA methylase [Clostridium manihotivorum]